MMSPFEDLIHALGMSLGIPLHVDHRGACCLQMNDKLRVQIEPDKTQDRIIIAAFITELNPGRFREDVLKEALKVNAQSVMSGNTGAILGFAGRHNRLSCHTFLSTKNLTSDQLLAALTYLSEQSLAWLDAVQSGQIIPAALQTNRPLPAPFGMRP